jgi:hypothetical protein
MIDQGDELSHLLPKLDELRLLCVVTRQRARQWASFVPPLMLAQIAKHGTVVAIE